MLVHLHAIGYSVTLSTWLFSEDAAIRERAVGGNVVHPNVAFFAVVYIKMFSVRRKGEAVRLGEIFCEQAYVGFIIEAIHALKRNFLLCAGTEIHIRISEIERTVRTDDNIVRRI